MAYFTRQTLVLPVLPLALVSFALTDFRLGEWKWSEKLCCSMLIVKFRIFLLDQYIFTSHGQCNNQCLSHWLVWTRSVPRSVPILTCNITRWDEFSHPLLFMTCPYGCYFVVVFTRTLNNWHCWTCQRRKGSPKPLKRSQGPLQRTFHHWRRKRLMPGKSLWVHQKHQSVYKSKLPFSRNLPTRVLLACQLYIWLNNILTASLVSLPQSLFFTLLL